MPHLLIQNFALFSPFHKEFGGYAFQFFDNFRWIQISKEDGRKYVAPKEPEATAILWAFNEIAQSIFACDQVRQKMNKLHKTTISRSAFHVAVRNPLYYGKIFISKFKDEEARLVHCQHESLIAKELFNRVQLILDRNKRTERPNTKIISDENLPLRGFLVCPECGRNMIGSASKGRTNRYYYDHCVSSCGFHQKAELANDIFENGMRQFELNDTAFIVKRLLLDNYKKFVNKPFAENKQIAQEIDKLNARL